MTASPPISLPRVAMLKEHGMTTREALRTIRESSKMPERLSGVRLDSEALRDTSVVRRFLEMAAKRRIPFP